MSGAPAGRPLRNVRDRQDVRRHVLADLAVAAGRGEHQRAVLVAQRAGQAVDLGLGGQRDRLVLAELQEAPHPADEIRHLLVGKGIVEAEHRQRMARPWRDAPAGAAPTCRDGLSSRTRCGNCASSAALSPDQRVIVRVGNLRRVVGMIEPVVPRDLVREPFQLGGGLGFGHAALSRLPEEGWREGLVAERIKIVRSTPAMFVSTSLFQKRRTQ